MDLDFDRWKMDHSPEAEAGVRDLAKSLFQMPSLRRLKLHCCIFVDAFFGTAATCATSSKLEELDIHLEIQVMKKDLVRTGQASQNLAQCLLQLPCLTRVKLRSNVLQEEFISTAVSLASSSKLEGFDIDTYLVGFRRRADFPTSETSSQEFATFLMSLPCLTYLQLTTTQSHEEFMSTLASFAPASQIQHVKIDYRGLQNCCSLKSDEPIRDYARFLFQMPCLTRLEVMFWDGEVPEAFWSTASELAASSQLQDLDLYFSRNSYVTPEEKATIHFAEFLLHLRHLSCLKISFRDFPPTFLATLAAGATTLRIRDLEFSLGLLTQDNMTWTEEIAKDIPRLLFQMPLLKRLKFDCLALTDIFFKSAISEAPSSQVEDLFLHVCIRRWDPLPVVERAAQDFARMLFLMPHLTHLVVECDTLPDIFFATAAQLAPSSKLQELTLDINIWRTHCRPRFGRSAARFLFQMPHLSSLKLKCKNLPDDFYAAAASLAPSSQIQELDLDLGTLTISPGTESAMRALAGLIFRMPRLTRLNLTCSNLPTVFYAAAVSMPPSPQLTDITINGRPYQHRYDQETQVLLQKLLPSEEDVPSLSDDDASTQLTELVASDDKTSTLNVEPFKSDEETPVLEMGPVSSSDKASTLQIEPVTSDEKAPTPQVDSLDVETGASQDGEMRLSLRDDDNKASDPQVHPMKVETSQSF
ncbi:uncharacterized protein [Diadema setosum]|uniref:uncharacterized protein n=1 Tax=Diadema setosum TaxID=31175 RepID=UPI003B3AF36A